MTSGYRAIGDDPRGDYVHGPSPTPFNPGEPLFKPSGSMYVYWDSAVNELGFLVTKIAEKSMKALFQERIGSAIGLDPNDWKWGDFGQVEGLTINGGAGNYNNHIFISAIALARFGHLILNRGYWNGNQLINPNWIDASTDVQVPVDIPLGWNRFNSPRWERGPTDTFGGKTEYRRTETQMARGPSRYFRRERR